MAFAEPMKAVSRRKISVIIPARNEAIRLKRNLKILDAFLQGLGQSYEVIIAEDGSSDGTGIIAKRIAERNSTLKILSFNGRLGKGGAINRALKLCLGEIIFLMDADLSADLEFMPQLLDSVLRTNGVAIGSRMIIGAKARRDLLRKNASKAYNLIVQLLFKTGIKDHQCGFKCLSKDAAQQIIPKIKDHMWIWDTEFLIRAKMEGFIVEEIPINWADLKEEPSILKILSMAPIMAYDLLMLKLRFI